MVKKGKGKRKKKRGAEENLTILTEVDKTFYELQITDINRKLARLRLLTEELEQKNAELEENYAKLDEDRADIIAYLKRTLQEKQNEIIELQERLEALQEAKLSEAAEFKEKIIELENEYKQMRELLTSEIKLITGKLNALEEFRIQRDELMRKFEDQERRIEEQEKRHKQMLYDAEKKYVLGKDAIKREMEKRLFDLAEDFQNASDLRIAATTHRVIRENIAVNNELDKLIDSIQKLELENESLKEKNRDLRLNVELYTEESNKALSDAKIQRGVINQLKADHKKLLQVQARNDLLIQEGQERARNLSDSLQREENLMHKVRLLEQNLHASRCQQLSFQSEYELLNTQATKLRELLNEVIMSIKSAIKLDQDPAVRSTKRENLLNNLLVLLLQGKDEVIVAPSLKTVSSVSGIYARGDLGFIPKIHEDKEPPPLTYNMDTQIGRSFEDMLKAQTMPSQEEVSSAPEPSEEVYEELSMEEFISEESTEEEFIIGEHSSDESYGQPVSRKGSLTKTVQSASTVQETTDTEKQDEKK